MVFLKKAKLIDRSEAAYGRLYSARLDALTLDDQTVGLQTTGRLDSGSLALIAKPQPSSYLLRIYSSLGQLLFWRANFFRIKISTEQLNNFLKQVLLLLCSIEFFRTATFSIKLILQKRYLLGAAGFFRKSYFLQTANFSKKQYSATCFSRGGNFTELQIFSTATLFIYKLYLGQ